MRIIPSTLHISLITPLRNALEIKQAIHSVRKLLKHGRIEAEIVASSDEVIVPRKRCILLHLVVPIQSRLAARDGGIPRRARRGIAADGELAGHRVAVGYVDAEGSEEVGEVVADVVDILNGINELGVVGNAVAGDEVVWDGCQQLIGILVGGFFL